MINEASCSKTPLQASSPPAEASTQLAPGFRFHPTDEELVRFYLKRKVSGRTIPVDAISEVDLYRAEPWDLPSRSRLRSRDLEWYFFTPLDRKYSNRSRTNRATIEGYWKTTGKDRPIQCMSRTVGMKKTLVYHAGRAPRGQRTNWVMHEYRLEDEDLTRAGIRQDDYVLCRIFQKSGPGPQNGAQYGAPFIEEEWEREEEEGANFMPVTVDRVDAVTDPLGQDFVQLRDFLRDPNADIQHPGSFAFETKSAEHEFDNQTEYSSLFVKEIFKDQDSLDDMPQDAVFSIPQDNKTDLNRLKVSEGLEDQPNCVSMQSNGYVQLKDIFVEDNTNSCSNLHSNHCLLERGNNNPAVDDTPHSKILRQKSIDGGSLNANGATNQLDHPQMYSAFHHDMNTQPIDHLGDVPWQYPSGQLSEDNSVYYDALSHEVLYSDDSFTFGTSLSPLAEFDLPEDLMAYYNATDDNLAYPPNPFLTQFMQVNSPELVRSNDHPPEVVGSCTSSSKEVYNDKENLAQRSSLGRPPICDGSSSGLNDNLTDVKQKKDCEEKALTKRLASMLDSISAPPAFADEAALIGGKASGQMAAAGSAALHLTAAAAAGMIQIEKWTAVGYAEGGFLLSYGSIVNKSVSCSSKPRRKLLGVFYSLFCRGGVHLFLLSTAVILALTYKIGD